MTLAFLMVWSFVMAMVALKTRLGYNSQTKQIATLSVTTREVGEFRRWYILSTLSTSVTTSS